jgi:prophage antirepressor-like protein
VCKALGFDDVQYAIRHYATTDYQIFGVKKEPFLSESGVQKLASLSRHADAPAFQKWFESEVLATLPKTRRRMKSASPSADVF